MPTVTFEHSVLRDIQARFGIEHEPELWSEKLGLIGCSVEHCDEETVDIEVFPDRPDLLSVETMAHAARPFLHGAAAEPRLSTRSGGITMGVDPSLEKVRPVILAALVRGVDTGSTVEEQDQFIQGLMDHQEKLHFALGRGRRRSSIGVHDFGSLRPPFEVITVPEDYSFTPLAMSEPLSIREILEQHPKGVEYAHLLEGFDRFPVILDATGAVLSFPPIINGRHTTVTEDTRDFFIDVTGWDARACEASLLLTCLAFAARGGTVETVRITGWDGAEFHSPEGRPREHRVPKSLLEDILGREFSDEQVAAAIDRMGGRLVRRRVSTDGPRRRERWAEAAAGEDEYIIEMPRWRSDILHPVDIVEDVAIGIGYEDLGVSISRQSDAGIPLAKMTLHRRIRESLQGQGLQQVQSLTLSNDADQFTRVRLEPAGAVTRLTNPITHEHTVLRQNVLPALLRMLAANRHHELPQRVFELGTVVRDHHNEERVAWAAAEVGGGFTAAKGMAQALLRDLGADAQGLGVRFEALREGDGPYLHGRGAKVYIADEWVGCIGEVDPALADEFELRVPIQAGEFDVGMLGRLIPDPV